MADQPAVQLSFEVGGAPPDTAVFTISGRPFAHRELTKGEEVHLKDKLSDSNEVVGTERIHSVKVT